VRFSTSATPNMNYYITKPCSLECSSGGVTARLSDTGALVKIPIETVSNLYLLNDAVVVPCSVFNLLNKLAIPVVMLDFFGRIHTISQPTNVKESGVLIIRQSTAYKQNKERLYIAKTILHAGVTQILDNIKYYAYRDHRTVSEACVLKIEELLQKLLHATTVDGIMGYEGNIRKAYYSLWSNIMPLEENFFRSYNPPTTPLNAILSYLNSLVYGLINQSILASPLSNAIGYIHAPQHNTRPTLCLDLSEIFKPMLADPILFSLVNKGMLKPSHYVKNSEGVLLSDEGKKLVLTAWDSQIKTTFQFRPLKRLISYQKLIDVNVFRLIKYLLGEQHTLYFSSQHREVIQLPEKSP